MDTGGDGATDDVPAAAREAPSGNGGGAGGENGIGQGGNGNGSAGNWKYREDAEDQPGWAWRNRKAVDEFHKAMEGVVDKGFSLKEFGDPFEERVGSG